MSDAPRSRAAATRWVAVVCVAGAAVVLAPFAPWVLLAVWAAIATRGVHRALAQRLGGRTQLAAGLTVAALVALAIPALLLLSALVAEAIDLVQALIASDRGQQTLRQLVSEDGHGASSSGLVELAMSQGERAWAIAQQIAGTATRIVIGILILVTGTFATLVEGDAWYAWGEAHVPIPATAYRRLAAAVVETGHGLAVGIVGAGLAQAVVATIVYLILGVPQPFALGLLTLVFSVVPSVGTAIVWVPIAAGLALTGRTGAAVAMGIAGLALISTVDNLVRPYLTRRGALQLPTYVVLVAMFGGIAMLGPWGLVLGPLIVRLAKESLAILREARLDTP